MTRSRLAGYTEWDGLNGGRVILRHRWRSVWLWGLWAAYRDPQWLTVPLAHCLMWVGGAKVVFNSLPDINGQMKLREPK